MVKFVFPANCIDSHGNTLFRHRLTLSLGWRLCGNLLIHGKVPIILIHLSFWGRRFWSELKRSDGRRAVLATPDRLLNALDGPVQRLYFARSGKTTFLSHQTSLTVWTDTSWAEPHTEESILANSRKATK